MKSASHEKSWLLATSTNPHARLRLFCFPYAGGGATAYYSWVSALAPEIEVCPVQLPGRENRLGELPFLDFSELIQALSQALLPYLTRPFAFYGHSMGALISYGLAQQLRQRHTLTPEHLFISSYRAPQIPNSETLHLLTDAELASKVLELDGTNPELMRNSELRQLLLPIMRADFSVCESYVHTAGEPLACRLTVFGGLQDKRVSQATLEAWREQTSATFALHMMRGGHFFLRGMQQPLLQIISQELARQQTGNTLSTSV